MDHDISKPVTHRQNFQPPNLGIQNVLYEHYYHAPETTESRRRLGSRVHMRHRATHIDMRPQRKGGWELSYSNLSPDHPRPPERQLFKLVQQLLRVDEPTISPLERSMKMFENNGGVLHPVQHGLLETFQDTVVYEDHRMLVANKPPYITTNWDAQGHVAFGDFAQHYTNSSVSPVHQIDRLTSGLVVMGKDPVARAKLSQQFQDKTKSGLKKVYLAQVDGAFGDDRGIRGFIDTQQIPVTFSTEPVGKLARTVVKNLVTFETDQGEPRSLIAVKIIDGRTHQIRVSVAAAGHPIIDDPLYNPKTPNPEGRMRLHAFKMGLVHPFDKDHRELTAPVPHDFYDSLDQASKRSLEDAIDRFSLQSMD